MDIYQCQFIWTYTVLFGNRCHEIKRHLLLGRKVTTIKSRDVTFLTKIRLVKAMVFPVVMYGSENWTIKKAEC